MRNVRGVRVLGAISLAVLFWAASPPPEAPVADAAMRGEARWCALCSRGGRM